jgi:hypothetical protein
MVSRTFLHFMFSTIPNPVGLDQQRPGMQAQKFGPPADLMDKILLLRNSSSTTAPWVIYSSYTQQVSTDLFLESLKQLYIIERTPEPGPSIPSREPTSASNPSPKVKRELADNDGSFVPKKRAKSLGAKTMIDLTGDSENENEETTSFH